MLFLISGHLALPSPARASTPQRHLNLYPDLLIRHEKSTEDELPNAPRLDLGKFWFANAGFPCETAFDTLATLWLTTRLVFVCPYNFSKTSLGVELTPEIQWPTGESVRDNPRPAVRFAHLLATQLHDHLEYYFKLSYKFAWQEKKSSQAPRLGSRVISAALVQDWSDLMDSTFQTGLIYFLNAKSTETHSELDTESAVQVSFEQTLPLSLRELGVLRSTALAKWSKLEVSYRKRTNNILWGAGLAYGNLSFEWIQLSSIFPVVYLGYDFGDSE